MNRINEELIHHRRYLFTLACLCGFGLRLMIALHPHSGEGKPPMFGDYEAQRHWMEITVNSAPEDWYKHSDFNDMQHWGLDYPPLTAYHSWLMGTMALSKNAAFVEPYKSRGLETPEHKIFMRQTVFMADVLFFFAIVYYYYSLGADEPAIMMHGAEYLLLSAIYPTLILVDHGHFQYNCISLGLTISAVALLYKKEIVFSSILFTMAVNFKQMSLYHALPFFIYILRLCFAAPPRYFRFEKLALVSATVFFTFVVLWAPYICSWENFLSVLARIFPVARGVFEDKVGSFWCAFNVIYKLKQNLSLFVLLRLCAGCTLLSVLPSLICLFRSPTHRQFLLSLINVSLGFFLFSFQVHEKTILLVAAPVLLYAHYDLIPCCWFLVVSHISLMHLSLKDNLINPFVSLIFIFCVYLYLNPDFFVKEKKDWRWLVWLSPTFLGGFGILMGFLLVTPPEKYPDFWPLMNALYSFSHFFVFFIYFNYRQITLKEATPNFLKHSRHENKALKKNKFRRRRRRH